jgi:hypothetical protein
MGRMDQPIYLDYQATTPLDSRVLDAMLRGRPWTERLSLQLAGGDRRPRLPPGSCRAPAPGIGGRPGTHAIQRVSTTFNVNRFRTVDFTAGAVNRRVGR